MGKRRTPLRPFSFLRSKRFRIGGYALLTTLLLIAIVVLINVGVKSIEDNWALRLDLSYNSLTKFSGHTRTALAELREEVRFYLLAAPGEEDALIAEVLDRYRAASAYISVQVIDPDKNPGVIAKYRDAPGASGLPSNTVIVANGEETRYKVYPYLDLVTLAMDEDSQQVYVRDYNFEKRFTQALLYVTAEKTPAVYLLQGHGEVPLSYLSTMQALLADNNYDVRELGVHDAFTASRTDILFILSPEKDLSDEERDRISAYLQDGGNMLYVCDAAARNDLANFNTLLHYYGVGFRDGMVVADPGDSGQYYPMQPAYLLPAIADHDITTPLIETNKDTVIVPQTRAIAMPAMERNDFTVTPLLLSKPGSYLIDTSRGGLAKESNDPDGPFPIGVAVRQLDFSGAGRESRVVLLGSTGAIADARLYNTAYNAEFLLSAVKWATKDEAINLGIVSKTAARAQLSIGSASVFYALAVISVGLLPLATLVAGVLVWRRRRHL